jgi:hypothetical protein
MFQKASRKEEPCKRPGLLYFITDITIGPWRLGQFVMGVSSGEVGTLLGFWVVFVVNGVILTLVAVVAAWGTGLKPRSLRVIQRSAGRADLHGGWVCRELQAKFAENRIAGD